VLDGAKPLDVAKELYSELDRIHTSEYMTSSGCARGPERCDTCKLLNAAQQAIAFFERVDAR